MINRGTIITTHNLSQVLAGRQAVALRYECCNQLAWNEEFDCISGQLYEATLRLVPKCSVTSETRRAFNCLQPNARGHEVVALFVQRSL